MFCSNQSRCSYSPFTALGGKDPDMEKQHTSVQNDTESSGLGQSYRSGSSKLHMSPLSPRKNYSEDNHTEQQMPVELNSLPSQTNHLPSYSNQLAATNSGLNIEQQCFRNNYGSHRHPSPLPEGRANGNLAHQINKKLSNIPFLSTAKKLVKALNHSERDKSQSALPGVMYKEQENVYPDTSVVYQEKKKFRDAVRETHTESKGTCESVESAVRDNSIHPFCKPMYECETRKDPVLYKDSVILSHFRMQKAHEQCNTENKCQEKIIQSNTIPPRNRCIPSQASIAPSEEKDHPSYSSHQPVSDRKLTYCDVKITSCLKPPGSPSLRAKHVTFAHKLTHHQKDDASGTTSHYYQNQVNKRNQLSSQFARTPTPSGQDFMLDSNIRNTMEQDSKNTIISDCNSSLQSEASDLQVVPCREGDTQAITMAVSAQGSNSSNYSSRFETPTPCNDSRAELIMSFSWMNETSERDTPCVSFIESHQSLPNHQETNGQCSSSDPISTIETTAAAMTSSKNSQLKSRKFRSRLAANFPIK